ncbi:MAG: ABC-2 transporter permease [Ruminococcus sp.]|nr:ABC-2 transporter permease [Ruminococcus sp.]
MRGLVYKDLMTEVHELKRMAVVLLVFLIGFPALMYATSDDLSELYGMPMTMCTVMGMVMINNSFAYDERSGWMQYALTNPISRIQYYHSKFLTHAVNILCGTTLGLAVGVIIAGVTGQLTISALLGMLTTTGLTAVGMCLVSIIFIPLMIKFGVQKGAIVTMVIFASVGGIGAALVVGLTLISDNFLLIIPIIAALILGGFITTYFLGRKWILEKEF